MEQAFRRLATLRRFMSKGDPCSLPDFGRVQLRNWIRCRVPDDRIAYRSYPLLAARELLQQFIREQVHGHQAA